MSTKNLSLFVNLAVAIIKGDDAEATAIKIQKKAIALLTAQIAAKVYHTLSLEEAVAEVTQELEHARVNFGNLIGKDTEFIKTLLTKRVEKEAAEKELADHLAEIAFLEEELAIAKG